MGILQAENNIAYSANNAIKIYIIKQEAYENKQKFEKDYASILGDALNSNKFLNTDNAAISGSRDIRLVPLLAFDKISNLYKECPLIDSVDKPDFLKNKKELYFLTSLYELRNCPLLDFSKLAYVFQIDGQSKGGLANVISFNTNFSVNGQSSAEIILNNKDFLYNFKYFNNKEKYPYHLKCYFNTNDIIIIRMQKKNVRQDSLLNSFKRNKIDYWEDPYISDEDDVFTTIFTGYINDINNSFSFSNGQQQLTLTCTGPSKKLTWTRCLSNKAPASRDSSDAILPISAYQNVQTTNENNKTNISNKDVIKNLIIRTYSGVLNIEAVKNSYKKFVDAFDKAYSIQTDAEIKDLVNKIKNIKDNKQRQNYQKQLEQRITELRNIAANESEIYNKTINENMNKFADEDDKKGEIGIKKQLFVNLGKNPYVFVIKGTDQPAYKWAFQNFSSLFKSDFSTVYQFIKGISDNLQFNFYDDPYGTIHFGVPNMTLMHLYDRTHPNNLNQLISFAESQNTENIANIQYAEASYTYDLPMSVINTVAKDYLSIEKYGEKMMQPFTMTGITEPAALRYAARMRMAKYNRKALSNIRVTMQGEPYIKFDKYAYIRSLRKLFYIESYSHSYNAGDNLITSLNGTFTREILALPQFSSKTAKKSYTNKLSLISTNKPISTLSDSLEATILSESEDFFINKQLENCTTVEDVMKILDTIQMPSDDILKQKIYQIYVDTFFYPKDNEDLKLDIGAMYNANSLKQCYLDGFFWEIPFDVDPYQIAYSIQQQEIKSKAQLSQTINTKKEFKKKVKDINKDIVKNIANDLVNGVTTQTSTRTVKGVANFNEKAFEKYTRFANVQKLNLSVKKQFETGTEFIYKPIEGNK